MVTDGRVVAAGGVLFERTVTVGRVEAARLVKKERTLPAATLEEPVVLK